METTTEVREVTRNLGGLAEVACLLGWTSQRLASERSKAREGRGAYRDMPDPVGHVRATPLFWLPEWRAYARKHG